MGHLLVRRKGRDTAQTAAFQGDPSAGGVPSTHRARWDMHGFLRLPSQIATRRGLQQQQRILSPFGRRKSKIKV